MNEGPNWEQGVPTLVFLVEQPRALDNMKLSVMIETERRAPCTFI